MKSKSRTLVVATALFGCMCGFAGMVTVEGKGTVMRRPDGMRLGFSIAAIDKDMVKSRTMLAEKRAKVKEVMAAAGVKEGEVSDSNFRMHPEYHVEDEDGNRVTEYAEKGKRVFDGYKHSMTCEFKAELDMVRLEGVYAAVVKAKCSEDLQVDFYLIDSKSVQDEARQMAVANARTVAEKLCKAASATLGEVKEINYNARSYGADICCAEGKVARLLSGKDDDAPLFPGINIEDIEVSDHVEVKWEIK